MPRIVVDVMLKPEILDPQGKAIVGALPRLGFTAFSAVRQGKRFELTVDGEVTEEILAQAREAAEKRAIEAALLRHRHRLNEAATDLGISRVTLYRLMGSHGLRDPSASEGKTNSMDDEDLRGDGQIATE